MSAISFREVIPRSMTHKFGESPTAERKFVVSTDGATDTTEIFTYVGINETDAHPEWPFLRMLSVTITEIDPYHAEINYSYSLPSQQDLDPNPLARPDVWSFSTGGAAVPAKGYYEGAGNAALKPLVNEAQDMFEGLETTESEINCTIAGNRAEFPLALAADVTNCVNDAGYLGGAIHTWLCGGISAQQATEMVNDEELRYWQVTVSLIYRASTHNLFIPDAGFNFLEGGVKKRCWVKGPPPDELQVASANAMPLAAGGAMLPVGVDATVLERRVHPEADFSTYFGVPPF